MEVYETNKGYRYREVTEGLVVLVPRHSNAKHDRGRQFFVALNDGRSGRAHDYTREGDLNDSNDPYVALAWKVYGPPTPRVKDVVRLGMYLEVKIKNGMRYWGEVSYIGEYWFRLVQVDTGIWSSSDFADIEFSDVSAITEYRRGDTGCF